MNIKHKSLLAVVVLIASINIGFGQVAQVINGFTGVEVFGKLNVRLEKSSRDSLAIESGSFDINKVGFTVADSILKIKLLTEFPKSIKVNITVFFRHISSLEVGGGAKLYNRGTIESRRFVLNAKSGSEVDLLLHADTATVKVNKGAFVRLTGQSNYLYLKTATGGDFRSTNMQINNIVAKMNGGTAEVRGSGVLDATVSFGATLKYVDQPKTIVRKERLGGSIGKLEDF